MFNSSLISALTTTLLIFGASSAQARNCTKGKPCGNSCISKNDVCHKTGGARTPSAAASESTEEPAAPATEANGKVKECKKGKRCGDSCIPKKAVCHAE